MKLSRRNLFIASGAALPGAFFATGAAAQSNVPWYRKMRLCAQHNLNEYDPKVLDIDAWLDYWASLKLDALVLTGGGFLAFYPTKLPNHRRSQFLSNRDLFGDYL